MTPEEQRMAIGEACGFTIDGPPDKKKGIIGWKRNGQYHSILPNYLNDLNAMNEAEKTLTSEQIMDYSENICSIVGHYHKYMASASQRAEAFLRTIGKWKDE